VLSHAADAVRADGLLFLAGVLPADAEGRLVGGHDVADQARRVFDDAEAILALAGAGWGDVLKLNLYLTDIDEAPLVDEVRARAVGASRPAVTLVEVTGLAVAGARVELDAVAVVA
jgi:2-iminobutanoate/2-iminopropanoate deaminase